MRWSVTFISIEVAVSMLGYLRKAFFISCVNVIMQYCWFFGGVFFGSVSSKSTKATVCIIYLRSSSQQFSDNSYTLPFFTLQRHSRRAKLCVKSAGRKTRVLDMFTMLCQEQQWNETGFQHRCSFAWINNKDATCSLSYSLLE